MPVVAQVSDLHLSPRVPARQAQAELVLAGINKARPDLTVVTGDLTDDGWDRPEDLVWAKQWMDERLDHEWFAVPGNHDVGNFAGAKMGAITAVRVQRWRDVFGVRKLLSLQLSTSLTYNHVWRIALLNSMAIGSGLHDERDLPLETGFEKDGMTHGDSLAVFIHSPLFLDRIDEKSQPDADYWLGPAQARALFLSQLTSANARLIASGHVHQTKLDAVAGGKGVGSRFHGGASNTPAQPKENDSRPLFDHLHIVWAPPASGTWVHAPGLPNPPAPERTGFVLHHLGDDGSVRSEVIECAPMLKTVFYDPAGQSEQ